MVGLPFNSDKYSNLLICFCSFIIIFITIIIILFFLSLFVSI